MLTLVIDIGAGVLSGAVSGIVTGIVTVRRARKGQIPFETFLANLRSAEDSDPSTANWTSSHRQLSADELIANKLRLAHALAERHSDRAQPRRWSRWAR